MYVHTTHWYFLHSNTKVIHNHFIVESSLKDESPFISNIIYLKIKVKKTKIYNEKNCISLYIIINLILF